MNYREKYNEWLTFDEATKAELLALTDEKEIEDRFYKELEFGTGGLRGVMGAGANRMNRYTVSKATQGLADYLHRTFNGKKSVAIAFDSRNHSMDFALCTAQVLAANGIKAFVFQQIMPTPVLSFAVRHLHCSAGIVVTASHNPKEYNGYKVYDEYGCQLVPKLAKQVIACVDAVTDLKAVRHTDLSQAQKDGLFEHISDAVLTAFIAAVKEQSIYSEPSSLHVVYTPLHGTGNVPVREILNPFQVSVVQEQALPDGDFSTVRSPNPEEKDALSRALCQAEKENADIVLGTDPDCDRVGVGVLHNGAYRLLTGNQVGALLVDFVLRFKENSLSENSTLVKTIVTSDLGAKIAEDYGLHIEETLTGFKYIGDKITAYEKSGAHAFVIGYEESYGYLVGTHARDKDAVVASMLICEMAAYYKNEGKTLVDALNTIYKKYGFYLDALDAFVLKGKDGAQRIQQIMAEFRANANASFNGVREVRDYATGIQGLPKENVLKFMFGGGTWLAIRPSGTEPKLKVYYSVNEPGEAACAQTLAALRAAIRNVIGEQG